MSPANLSVGTAYYRLTFADTARTIPGVTPMIYVGANIFPDDDAAAPVYYFQDTVSHSVVGSVANAERQPDKEGIEIQVYPHTEADLATGIMTLAEVLTALTDAHKRATWRH